MRKITSEILYFCTNEKFFCSEIARNRVGLNSTSPPKDNSVCANACFIISPAPSPLYLAPCSKPGCERFHAHMMCHLRFAHSRRASADPPAQDGASTTPTSSVYSHFSHQARNEGAIKWKVVVKPKWAIKWSTPRRLIFLAFTQIILYEQKYSKIFRR
jgi:hypothetical protein